MSGPGLPELTIECALAAARAASSKSLDETLILDVGTLMGITDHVIITSGRNDRQVKAIVDEVTRVLREECHVKPIGSEGQAGSHWVLLDYGDFVVHVFDGDARKFYGLERLWSDAPVIAFEWHGASNRAPCNSRPPRAL